MDELKRKRIGRGVLRSHLKKIETKIKDCIYADLDATQLANLNSLKMNFEDKVAKIKGVDDEIFALITDEKNLEEEMSKSLMESDIYYDILAQVEEKLAKQDTKPSADPLKFSSGLSSSLPRSSIEKVKLPKIELKKFDGDILKWQTFWDQYESAVHKQPNLSDVDKFSYLRTLLSATASESISGLALTNENYNEAVNLLNERFGNKQLLINAYMDSFHKIQAVKSMNQVKELRTIYDQLESTVRNLNSMDVKTEMYGCFLVPILTQKLPNELKMIMSREFKNNIWDFNEMLKISKQELQAKERC